MTVQVSNPAFVYDLLASLKRANYSASLSGDTTVEVSIPPAATIEQARSTSASTSPTGGRATRGSSRTSFAELTLP